MIVEQRQQASSFDYRRVCWAESLCETL